MGKRKENRQNTLRGNEPRCLARTRQTLKSIQRRIQELIGKRLPPAAEVGSGVMTMPPAAVGDTAFRLSGVLVLGIIFLILIFGSILGIRLYSVLGMGTNRVKNIPVVYIQGERTMKFKGPLMEVPATITEELLFDSKSGYDMKKNTEISESGKELLYLNNLSHGNGDLFLRNIDREKPRGKDADSRGQLVASGVLPNSLSFVNDDKTVMYMRDDGENGKLLLRWKNGKEQLLDSRINKLLGTTKNGVLYYTIFSYEETAANTISVGYSLCRANTDGTVQVLAENLNGQTVELNREEGSVIFSDTKSALWCWTGSELQPLSDRVGSVVDYGGGASVFYIEKVIDKTNPMQYFEDDMVAVDAIMTEPVEKDFMVETKNIWGKKKTVLDEKAYAAATTAYEAKLNRDNIRTAIAAQERSKTRYALYYNAGISKTMVDEDIILVNVADAANGVAVYTKERIPKPSQVKISQVTDPADAIRIISAVRMTVVRDSYYVNIGREPELFLSATENERVLFELDAGRGLYYIKGDSNAPSGQLSYVSVQEDGLGVAKKLDDKVINLMDISYRNQLLYTREGDSDETVTICGVSGGAKSRLIDGLPIFPMPSIHGDVILCYRDYKAERGIGSLTLYNNGNIKPVARNTYSYSYRLPNYIYALCDYDSGLGEGDLYLYSGNSEKLKLIDSGVSAIA